MSSKKEVDPLLMNELIAEVKDVFDTLNKPTLGLAEAVGTVLQREKKIQELFKKLTSGGDSVSGR